MDNPPENGSFEVLTESTPVEHGTSAVRQGGGGRGSFHVGALVRR